MKKAPAASRTLMGKDDQSEFRVVLPVGARVTFGPDIPNQRANHMHDGQRSYALRVYAGRGNDTLIACFSHVQWFRDTALDVSRLIIREAGKTLWKNDEKGYEVNTSVQRDAQFVDTAHRLNE